MKGRKRTPANLVLLRGNPGKRAVNRDEPKPRAGRPRCPAWLTPSARKHFARICHELTAMGILAASDFGRIAECASALAKAQECQEKIARYGYWESSKDPETGKVTVDRWPWTFEEPKAWEQFSRAAACLGLDPTSRARLKADPAKPKQNAFSEALAL